MDGVAMRGRSEAGVVGILVCHSQCLTVLELTIGDLSFGPDDP